VRLPRRAVHHAEPASTPTIAAATRTPTGPVEPWSTEATGAPDIAGSVGSSDAPDPSDGGPELAPDVAGAGSGADVGLAAVVDVAGADEVLESTVAVAGAVDDVATAGRLAVGGGADAVDTGFGAAGVGVGSATIGAHSPTG
jgi:hypothetical protein